MKGPEPTLWLTLHPNLRGGEAGIAAGTACPMLVLLTGVPGKKAKPGELYPSATGLGCGNAHLM